MINMDEEVKQAFNTLIEYLVSTDETKLIYSGDRALALSLSLRLTHFGDD